MGWCCLSGVEMQNRQLTDSGRAWKYAVHKDHESQVRHRDARGNPENVSINPTCLLPTEKNLDLEKICKISSSFSFEMFKTPSPPCIISIDGVCFIKNGHHRIAASILCNKKKIPVIIERF